MLASLSVATLIELGEQLNNANVQLCFNGPFTSGIIQHFGAALRAYLQHEQSDETEVTGVFSVYIEMAQNIQRYVARHSEGLAAKGVGSSNGIIVIGRSGAHTSLIAGNWLLSESVGPLKSRLDEIRALDGAGLKAMYKKQMRSAPVAEGEGAGLGLLTIARHAASPITYELQQRPTGLTFFSLLAEV